MAHVERIMYVELKTGFGDNGPAWIGRNSLLQDRPNSVLPRPQSPPSQGISGNYIDVATLEEYWISGVKKDGSDRHWAGGGAVEIDLDVRSECLRLIDPKVAARLKR